MLSWEPCAEDDVEHYTVYGVAEDPATPETSTETLGTTSVEQYDVSAYSSFVNYLVTATDDAGNEGDPGDLGPTPIGAGRAPEVSRLSINAYPNPFNPETVIRYALPRRTFVRIDLFDVSGRLVCELVSGVRNEGTHAVRWDGTNSTGSPVASGVFVARIETDDRVKTTKLVLLK
jgi:hypothetical protein